MIEIEKIKNMLISYCYWEPMIDGWAISDSDLDKFFESLDKLNKRTE